MTLHLPQTAKTEGMINRNVLAAVKPGTILLNFARGGLIDDDAVIEALESGQLGRYVTDFPNDRIIANSKVIAMPHLGASTLEAEENCARMAAAQLKEYLISGTIKNSVNFPDCEYPLGRVGVLPLSIVMSPIWWGKLRRFWPKTGSTSSIC